MKNLLMMMLFATTVGVQTASAQQPKVVLSDKDGWHKIGETTVDLQKETDEVVVIGANRFASIKFKVTDASIDIASIEVYYEKGDTQKIPVNLKVSASGDSKEINLKGGSERDIKKIVFVYKTIANNKDNKAHVEIWGFKTNTDKK